MTSAIEPLIFESVCRTSSILGTSPAALRAHHSTNSVSNKSAKESPLSMVIRTCCCSSKSRGSKGRRTPFSYIASISLAITLLSHPAVYHHESAEPADSRQDVPTESAPPPSPRATRIVTPDRARLGYADVAAHKRPSSAKLILLPWRDQGSRR